MKSIKNFFTKDNLFLVLFIIIAIHPIIELDYLLYGTYADLNITRLTTIVDYIVIPLILVIILFLYEKDRKRLLFLLGFVIVFILYFIIHCISAYNVSNVIHLTDNYSFSIKDELLYAITILIPLGYLFLSKNINISKNSIKRICVTLSVVTALPIVISDIYIFGQSTYSGMTYDSIFGWFKLPFHPLFYHPRRYACKFFFEEGNTIGILLMMILPLLYYFFNDEKKLINKILFGTLIFLQSIAMIMLSTRLSTYGAALIPFIVFVAYIIICLANKEKINKLFIAFLILMCAICSIIIPFSPAYRNQLIDASDYGYLKVEDQTLESAKGLLKDTSKYEKWSKEWRDFYAYMFEDYSFLIKVTPPIYYTEWYSYKYDPEFWVDVIFDYPLEERVNGRQIETIFTKYKWSELNSAQKLVGLGYSTFMNGGILIERDFVQQYYSFGLIGLIILFAGWVVVTIFAGVIVIIGYKKGTWNLLNISLLMSIGFGFVSSVVSGHTFDELTTSLFISLCLSMLLKRIYTINNEKN